MPFLPVDTAIQVVVGPLVDDTDFISIETGVAWNAAGMAVDLIQKDVNSSSKTDLTLSSGGDNDWVELGTGMYSQEITAAQNDTLGELSVIGIANGIMVFMSPSYTVVPVVVYNSLVAGSDTLQVDLTQMVGVAQSAADLKDFADAGYDPGTNKVQGVVLVDTTTTNTDQAGTDNAATAAALATAQADLDTITGGDGVTLATAQANYAPATATAMTTAQNDLDILTGGDGAILNTTQANYAPATAAALATHDGKIDTAQLDLDKITGTDGATLATAQANYTPSTHSAADVVTAMFAKTGLTAGGVATFGDITIALYATARGRIVKTGAAYAYMDDDDATTLHTLTIAESERTTA